MNSKKSIVFHAGISTFKSFTVKLFISNVLELLENASRTFQNYGPNPIVNSMKTIYFSIATKNISKRGSFKL